MIKLLMAVFVMVFAASTVMAEEEQPTLATVKNAPDLEKAKGKFQETFVSPEADFTRYNKLYLGDAFFDYRDVGEAKSTRSSLYNSSRKSVFGISNADREKFEDVVDQAFMKELGKGKRFEVTEQLDENTIIMRGAVVDIVSNVPPEFVGRSEVYLAKVGEATLVLEFLDGRTGDVLARVAERRAFGRPGGQIDMLTMPTNSVTVWADVSRWASSAARRLRSELDLAVVGK